MTRTMKLFVGLTGLTLALAVVVTLPIGLVDLTGEALAAAENPCGGKADNPCNPCGGKGKAAAMPAVNPCHAKMGSVFYIADPMNRNTITFTSRAPLEDIIGTSNQIRGYIVFDPDNPKQGGHGEFSVPTASLTTGIPLRDEHLRSGEWLDADRNDQITFKIETVKSVRLVKETRTFKTYELQVTGPFTLHGRTRPIEFTARITFLAESEQTRQKMPGDLLAGRARFDLSLRDFGVKGLEGVVGSKVNDQIGVEISFTATTNAS